jgi:hypothetical protein
VVDDENIDGCEGPRILHKPSTFEHQIRGAAVATRAYAPAAKLATRTSVAPSL